MNHGQYEKGSISELNEAFLFIISRINYELRLCSTKKKSDNSLAETCNPETLVRFQMYNTSWYTGSM